MVQIRKELKYLVSKEKRPVLLRAFHIWQRKPHEVAPLSDTPRCCSSCGTAYQGNYCPRCGQAAAIGRFSFKKALLLFIDVWGVGNRGMFRSIRDLMLRPGYMIRDYLRGMQSAYFPPFKMFFLLTALALVVEHGFSFLPGEIENGSPKTTEVLEEEKIAKTVQQDEGEKEEENEAAGAFATSHSAVPQPAVVPQPPDHPDNITINGEEIDSPMYHAGVTFAKQMNNLRESNPDIFALLSLLMFSLPLYFFLRRSPTIPDLRYSEFVVALVYTANAYSIYSIAGKLLDSGILKLIAVLIIFVTVKQFSGYSKRRVLGYIMLTAIISALVLMLLVGIVICIAYLLYGSPE